MKNSPVVRQKHLGSAPTRLEMYLEEQTDSVDRCEVCIRETISTRVGVEPRGFDAASVLHP